MIYLIIGKYRTGMAELVDEFDSKDEAEQMLAEYRMAYGPDWLLYIRSRGK